MLCLIIVFFIMPACLLVLYQIHRSCKESREVAPEALRMRNRLRVLIALPSPPRVLRVQRCGGRGGEGRDSRARVSQ